MGLFKCLNFQSFPLYLSKRKASVHFHEQMPCLKAVFLQPPFSAKIFLLSACKYSDLISKMKKLKN